MCSRTVKVTGVDMLSHSHTPTVSCVYVHCTPHQSAATPDTKTVVIDSTPPDLPQVTWGKRATIEAATRHLVVEADTRGGVSGGKWGDRPRPLP